MLNLVSRALAETNLTDLTLTPKENSVTDLGALLDIIVPWVSIAAGVIAFAFLLYSGFVYLTAGGNAESAKKGQAGILNAIIGLIIIALAYTITTAIIGTINTAT